MYVCRRKRNSYTPYMYGDYDTEETGVEETAVIQDQELKDNSFSVSVSSTDTDSRQVIEIIFKLVGNAINLLDYGFKMFVWYNGSKIVLFTCI